MEARKLGRYEIVAELGKGAMGTVYKAIDPLLERVVAIKTISISADDPEMAEYEARFYHEAKAVGGLNHRNIVTVYDVAKSANLPYLAMELLDGHELGSLMAKGRPLPAAHALDIAAQVADGLAYAHEHGVVHRDIKPANIMVMKDGLVKIADFGIARMRSRSTDPGAENVPVLGSPRYMSPEQVLRKRAGAQSDIFSLGVVLYEMLTGAPPFAGADLNAILFQIVNVLPPAPSTVADMPDMVDYVVAKALAKSPDERYESAAELANDLRECRRKVDAPPPLATLEIFKQSVPRLDPYGATPLAQSFPDAREGDLKALEPDAATSTLGLAKEFDSFSATARLAVNTGVAEDFGELVKPQENAGIETATVYGTLVRDQSAPRIVPRFGPGAARWDPRDKMIFSASIVAAVLLAGLIVIL